MLIVVHNICGRVVCSTHTICSADYFSDFSVTSCIFKGSDSGVLLYRLLNVFVLGGGGWLFLGYMGLHWFANFGNFSGFVFKCHSALMDCLKVVLYITAVLVLVFLSFYV